MTKTLTYSNLYASTSFTLGIDVPYGPAPARHWDNNIPKSQHMKCKHCGVRSMIPQATDKILALVCPQCGGALDE